LNPKPLVAAVLGILLTEGACNLETGASYLSGAGLKELVVFFPLIPKPPIPLDSPNLLPVLTFIAPPLALGEKISLVG